MPNTPHAYGWYEDPARKNVRQLLRLVEVEDAKATRADDVAEVLGFLLVLAAALLMVIWLTSSLMQP
jgi:hypothetical protein